MAHFAKIDENNVVVEVIVAEQDYINSLEDASSWIQTSYNTRGGVHYAPNSDTPDEGEPLRKNYAGIGFTYDSDRDAFIPPKPFPSWSLNEESCLWESPVPRPADADTVYYVWDEDNQSWNLYEG